MTIGLFGFHFTAGALNNVSTIESMKGVSVCSYGFDDHDDFAPNVYNKGMIGNLFSFFNSYLFWFP